MDVVEHSCCKIAEVCHIVVCGITAHSRVQLITVAYDHVSYAWA